MTAELNGLPAVNGTIEHANGLSNPTPAHPAFDSIPDVIQAFGTASILLSRPFPLRVHG
jgi:3,4-dihydroxy 2-butanone 4-phosphate synthase